MENGVFNDSPVYSQGSPNSDRRPYLALNNMLIYRSPYMTPQVVSLGLKNLETLALEP